MCLENGADIDQWTYDEIVQLVDDYYRWWDEQNANYEGYNANYEEQTEEAK